MKVEIDINNRLYDDIKEMCDLNGIVIEEYILNTISDSFYTLKYGDLNEKFNKKEEKEKETIVVVEETKEKKKTTTRKKSTKKEETIVNKEENEDKSVNEKDIDDDEPKTIKRKRTLKVK